MENKVTSTFPMHQTTKLAGAFVACTLLMFINQRLHAETNVYKIGPVTVKTSPQRPVIPAPKVTLAFIGHTLTNYGGSARNVAVLDSIVYLANSQDGLRILDVSDPTKPTTIGHAGKYYAQGLAVAGSALYVASHDGLRIYDVSDARNPVLLNQQTVGGPAFGVTVEGNYAYLANGDKGLMICDISKPSTPVVLSTTNNGGSAYGVAVFSNFVYVANSSDGLRIYDASDVKKPLNVRHLEGYALDIKVAGTTAYVVGGWLQIYDISNPSQPLLLSNTGCGGFGVSVALSGKYAYVANQTSNVCIYDVSDPKNPQYIANTTTNAGRFSMVGVTASATHTFLANGTDGVRIYSLKELDNISGGKTDLTPPSK